MNACEVPRPWSGTTLTRVPYWVYQDEANYRAELRRIFEGPVWNYLCLESDIARPGRLPDQVRGRDAGDRRCAARAARCTPSRTAAPTAAP